MSGVHMEGPFGGQDGTDFKIPDHCTPKGLVSIQIWTHDEKFSAISFTYIDECGSPITKGPFGQDKAGAKPCPEIKIGEGEVIRKISGYYAPGEGRITSLAITTNIAPLYGPFGTPEKPGDTPFGTIHEHIVAFFGKYNEEISVNAIGTYYIK